MAPCDTMILIVDSNSYISGKIAQHFFVDGETCCVSQCSSLECAQIMTSALPFKFVLMDALTAGIGRQAFSQYRIQNPGVKIMVYSTKLSGAEFSVVKNAALEAGADFFGDEFQLINRVREELTRPQQASRSLCGMGNGPATGEDATNQ